MKLFTNILIQGVATAAQAVNIFTPILSEKNKVYATGVLTIAQGITALVAHNSNPDGTSCKTAYIPEKTEKR